MARRIARGMARGIVRGMTTGMVTGMTWDYHNYTGRVPLGRFLLGETWCFGWLDESVDGDWAKLGARLRASLMARVRSGLW